ncbi:MAG TPA: GTP cyclohydrolase II [Calditrichia bacterium]|nr:GTP cyclohydrolase II [Calditrichota bacterium]HQV32655.1 GTP cyclohydrolase II [Calditrichia bacterium]
MSQDNTGSTVTVYAQTNLPTLFGEFRVTVFHNAVDEKEHLAISAGDLSAMKEVPVRIHSECLTSEVLGSLKCDCREQLHAALEKIAREGGVLLYMRQEGRGIGLGNKIRAYALQEEGYDTVEANHILGFPDDLRRYDLAAAMLREMGITTIRLMTNNPKKIKGLEEMGISVVARIPLEITPNEVNREYLKTKARKSGHLLQLPDTLKKMTLVG